MATKGTALLDFGAFPGGFDASIVITGQAAILAGSYVEAWIFPADTADHTADEHMLETLKVFATTIVAGTGFTIYGFTTQQTAEPLEEIKGRVQTAVAGALQTAQSFQRQFAGGNALKLYGKWNIAWVWD
jgi:hypothetical protein